MALIYFLTSDVRAAEREAASFGWHQVALRRWYTAERDDVRVVTDDSHMVFYGAVEIMPASDLIAVDSITNPAPWRIKQLAKRGLAKWRDNPALGAAGTAALIRDLRAPLAAEMPSPPKPIRELTEAERLREAGMEIPGQAPLPQRVHVSSAEPTAEVSGVGYSESPIVELMSDPLMRTENPYWQPDSHEPPADQDALRKELARIALRSGRPRGRPRKNPPPATDE